MGDFIVHGTRVEAPGIDVRNYVDDGVYRFPAQRTRTRATELVIHETVTRSADSTVAVLRKRGLSVHLVLGPDGQFTQHGDLASDVLAHAGAAHNPPSIGVEVVNPYYPRLLKKGPWERTIKAPWAHEGAYVLPTPAQAEAVAALVRWTTSSPAPGLEVPRAWPGLRADGRFTLGRVAAAKKALPGVLAHHYFGHADGAWLVLYAWLRIEAGLTSEVAWEEAVKRATGVRRADVREMV